MKEVRYFYVPAASQQNELPEDEAQHAVRVLRMQEGDEMVLIDGCGNFVEAVITEASKKHCRYSVREVVPQTKSWSAHLHLALAPTKNMDRTEWVAEKATEIGFDEMTFLRCQFSERTTIKCDRIDKILVSAMKQSRKATKPVLNDMTDFRSFVQQVAGDASTDKFICHCYDEPDIVADTHLKDALSAGRNAVVLVGPEGDFSVEEVRLALSLGFRPVTLGRSRLRTETAALVAVHLMQLQNS